MTMPSPLRNLIDQYCCDPIGQQRWSEIQENDDVAVLRTIFLEGACFDFASVLSDLTGWPVYEIQWGIATVDDPKECEDKGYGIHRVVKHPTGGYLDASGWTDVEAVLRRVNGLEATYQWIGEVDPDGGVFSVDVELVKQAVVAMLPDGVDVCDASPSP